MKKFIPLLVSTLLIGCSVQAKQAQASFLFVQKSTDIHFQKLTSHCYRSTLSNVKPTILYFSASPKKIVGHSTIPKFLQIWSQTNQDHNGAIEGKLNNKDYLNIFTFSEPAYNAHKKEVSYKTCITDPQTSKTIMPNHLKNAVIFFDNYQPGLGF
jgi:hypothetical protein